jgi:hypothetical protein
MSAPADRSLVARLRAFRRGERDASDVEALTEAGRAVYMELEWADQQAARRALAGPGRWEPPLGLASHAVASWVAFVLHATGEGLIVQDYRAKPELAGFLPPSTHRLAWECLLPVGYWLSLARQARESSGFDIRTEVRLPVDLPGWFSSTDRYSPEGSASVVGAKPVTGLNEVIDIVRPRAEYLVFQLSQEPVPDGRRQALTRLREVLAASGATAEYWRRAGDRARMRLLANVAAAQLYQALRQCFRVGQLATFPAVEPAAHAVIGHRERHPLQVGAVRPAPAPTRHVPTALDLPALPFDLHAPPPRPPSGCADPAGWRMSRSLLEAHKPDTTGACRCGWPWPCRIRRTATVGLAATYLCRPGTPWPAAVRKLQQRLLADPQPILDGWLAGIHARSQHSPRNTGP